MVKKMMPDDKIGHKSGVDWVWCMEESFSYSNEGDVSSRVGEISPIAFFVPTLLGIALIL